MTTDLFADDVAKDGPVECYRKGYEEGYEAGKRVATIGMWAKGYQAGFGCVRESITNLLAAMANEPIPAQTDGSGCA